MEALKALERDKPKYLACDTETTGVSFFDEAFLATIAWFTPDKKIRSYYFELPDEKEKTKSILTRVQTIVFHNAKFDLQKLQLCEVFARSDRPSYHDTEALLHLLDEHQEKGLEKSCTRLLGVENWKEPLKKEFRKLKLKKSDGYHKIPRDILIPYALKDSEYTLLLFDNLLPKFKAKADETLNSLYDLERELTWALLDTEWEGMKIDRDYVENNISQLSKETLSLELKTRDLAGVEIFNPNSSKQIREYFEKRGILRDSYDKHNLVEIDDPMAETLLELRKKSKLLSTYFMAMKNEVDEDGILHSNFRQHGTRTGRMSSGGTQD